MNPTTSEIVQNLQNQFSQVAETDLKLSPSRRKSGSIFWFFLFLILLGCIGLSVWYFWPSNTSGSTDVVGTVARGDLVVMVTDRGELESSKSVDVRCEIEGRQAKIIEIVPEGTTVKKDDVVVKFDTEEINKMLNDQRIKLRQAEGKAQVSAEKLKQAENKAKSDIEKAELALKLARLDLEKYKDPKGEFQVLYDKARSDIMIAKKELEEARTQLENLRTVVKRGLGAPEALKAKEMQVERTGLALDGAEKGLYVLEKFTKVKQEAELESKAKDAESELIRTKSSSDSSIIEAKSQLESDQVTADLEKRALERLVKQEKNCIIKAPQDGIIVYSKERYWDPQAAIRAGALVFYQQNLFSLPDLTKMKVKVKVHESMIKKVKKDQPCEIISDAMPGKPMHGKVLNVATLADSRGSWDERSVKEYVVEVSVDDLLPEAGLKPGMSAEVRINAGEYKQQLLVPMQAVTEREGKHFAYLLTGSKAEKREVTVGENNEKYISIVKGVQEGEKVALNARRRMTDEIKAETKQGQGQGELNGSAPATTPGKSTPAATPVAPVASTGN